MRAETEAKYRAALMIHIAEMIEITNPNTAQLAEAVIEMHTRLLNLVPGREDLTPVEMLAIRANFAEAAMRFNKINFDILRNDPDTTAGERAVLDQLIATMDDPTDYS
jgi:hypothetical protein